MPQHLELGDVIAFGLGALDLTLVAAGVVIGWWSALVLGDALALRLLIAFPTVLVGVALGIVRVGERPVRTWLLLALAYARRPRTLVTGGTR